MEKSLHLKTKNREEAQVEMKHEASLETRLWSYLSLLKEPSVAVFTLAFIIGALARFWALDIKPPHFDEGINGYFVERMWRDGFYLYDPTNFHGPLYFYFLQFAELVFGPGIVGYRLITGVLSLATVVVIAMHLRWFRAAALWAAAAVAVSPAFVFYSRYAIHESLFILLQVVFTYGFFLWREARSRVSLGLMIFSVAASVAVKETFFIFFGTWAIAIASVKLSDRMFPRLALTDEIVSKPNLQPAKLGDGLQLSLIAGLILLLVFSGFFMNPKGIIDMVKALVVWTGTGVSATGHEKPPFYWLQLLLRYEWPFLVALIVSPFVFFTSRRSARLLVISGFGLWLAYSLIPYKTPWLALSFYWLLAFTLGLSIENTTSLYSRRWIRVGVLLVGSGLLALSLRSMALLNFKNFTDPTEPYVYVQSTSEFKTVMDLIELQKGRRPEDRNMVIKVLNRESWPMPWILSRFPKVQYAPPDAVDLKGADVILVDESKDSVVRSRLTGRYWVLPFQVRDSYEKGRAYLAYEKFEGLVPATAIVFEPTEEKKP